MASPSRATSGAGTGGRTIASSAGNAKSNDSGCPSPQPPCRARDLIFIFRRFPEIEAAVLVALHLRYSQGRSRGDHRAEICIVVAAGLDEAERIALPFHIGEQLVVFMDKVRERQDQI